MVKASFVGEYKSKLDEKGRMVFPSELKSQLALLEQKNLIVKKDLYQRSLTLYTQEAWDKKADEMRQKLNLFDKEHSEIWGKFMKDRASVTPDEKSGRILIPRYLLEKIGAVKEMVFVGMDDSICLWAVEEYAKADMSDEEFTELVAKHLGNH